MTLFHLLKPCPLLLPSQQLAFVSLTQKIYPWAYLFHLQNLSPAPPLAFLHTLPIPAGFQMAVSFTWANALTWTPLSSLIPSIPQTLPSHTEFITFLQTCQHLCNFMPLKIFLPPKISSLSPFPTWKTLIHSSKLSSYITSSGLSEILPVKVNLFCWTPLAGCFPILVSLSTSAPFISLLPGK